jgi:hypothetical protein
MAKPLLGEILLEKKEITREQLDKALEVQKTEGGLIGIIRCHRRNSEQTLSNTWRCRPKGLHIPAELIERATGSLRPLFLIPFKAPPRRASRVYQGIHRSEPPAVFHTGF